ncbi:hypothetical protein [Paeniglutamicibacter psychrophenolicus]|uniref:hypothetical protein n=1 Tax=Paeniglutamicibacter psychrophenolicus TaxID=257454 RepID=UPI00278A0DD5|nr:hypothetical protein [Paeniglutamicibacter psychrophenolicus]MDQ0095439.1 hypothetical protein [Paeniglutamicibacter psychrophenolicus]
MADMDSRAQLAAMLAEQALQVATKLKPGSWESVQALSTLSIAQSLLTMNQQQQEP